MSNASSIEWTDATWNPTRGCSRVSEGCRNCYAERIAARFADVGKPFHGFASIGPRADSPKWTGRVELIPEKLDEPLRWRKPRRVFVNSMSDLFHEKLSLPDIAQVFSVMASATLGCAPGHRNHDEECWTGDPHTFQILTKRPAQMLKIVAEMPHYVGEHFNGDSALANETWPLPNVWLGVSVEDQKTADERIPLLLQTPAAVRFVSYEPALGPVDFGMYLSRTNMPGLNLMPGFRDPLPGIDWLIIGGESGPRARPFDIDWARSAIAQCKAGGVACFVKQLGSYPVLDPRYDRSLPGWTRKLQDRKGGDMAEWPEDLRVREFPAA